MSPSPQNPGTRERILILLQEKKTVTVPEISHAWGLTRADVRHHLNLLVKDGLVEITPGEVFQTTRRGRPVLHYHLAGNLAPNNFPSLCSALLGRYLAGSSADQREPALLALVQHVTGKPSATISPTHRLNQAVSYLNQHSYRARWEASPTGPRLLFRNCPYAVILNTHPELCEFDRLLVERLCDMSVKQVARVDLVTGIPPACIFLTNVSMV